MTVDQLYDHIISQMPAEEALKRLLTSSMRSYEKLKFENEEEAVHPMFIMAMAAMDMGWDFLIERTDSNAEVEGMVVGTENYMRRLHADKGAVKALKAITEHYVEIANSGDCGHWNPEEEEVVIEARRQLLSE